MKRRTPAQQHTDNLRNALKFLRREQRALDNYENTLPLSGHSWTEAQETMRDVLLEYVDIAAANVAHMTGWQISKGKLITWAQRTA